MKLKVSAKMFPLILSGIELTISPLAGRADAEMEGRDRSITTSRPQYSSH